MYYFFKWTLSVFFFLGCPAGIFFCFSPYSELSSTLQTLPVYFPVFILQGVCAAILVTLHTVKERPLHPGEDKGQGFFLWHDHSSFLKIYLLQPEGETQQQTSVFVLYFSLSHYVIIWPERK